MGIEPPELGIIEGYWGRPWSFADRTAVMTTLAGHGYRFFMYAPKLDPYLRERWREPHPADLRDQLAEFADACHAHGVRFGVGLSPFELYRDFAGAARDELATRLAQLDELGVDDLAILFDDMRGDLPGLARSQADIVAFVADRSRATRIVMCPSYYTDAPILDRMFGTRPDGYLEDLGRLLDPAVEVFWTGEEVCSRELSPGHLADVAERIGRRPFLWDNYPVNDGPIMSQSLHVRGFTGRPAANATLVAAHAVNPALQPHLSTIPALTLVDSYRDGDRYRYLVSTTDAVRALLPDELATMFLRDLMLFEVGLDRLGPQVEKMRRRWSAHDHPVAREIVAWLDGEYRPQPGHSPGS